MTFRTLAAVLIIAAMCADPAPAQMAPPSVRSTKPLGLVPGKVADLEILGDNLDGASSVLFDDLDATVESIVPAKDRIKLKVRIGERSAPGLREFRVVTTKGLSNAGRVIVTRPLPLVASVGSNHGFRSAQKVEVPCTVEGVLTNGDEVHVYSVEMTEGHTLVAEAFAARGGSGLDALVTIFSPEGREIAADDDLFGRDAACWFTAPASGCYFVQIQDADGRNRDGNIEGKITREYLLTIGEVPLVVSVYPPGARRGGLARFDLLGVNLPEGRALRVEFPEDAALGDRPLRIEAPRGVANAPVIRLGNGPEVVEPDPEPADDPLRPMPVTVPGAINGKFSAIDDGDIDYYRLIPAPGHEGDYAITVYSARVGSPADPIVAAVDARGASQAEDDDKLGRDARIERRIDAEGLTIAVREAFGRGGPRFIYRVEVEPVHRRRIVATADLGARTIPRSGSMALPITLDRQEDDGPATILAGEMPPGVTATPITIPAKAKAGVLVLTASADAPIGLFPFRLVVRDTKGTGEVAYRERGEKRGKADPNANKDGGGVAVDRPRLSVADPATLGVAIGPEEIAVKPGETAEMRIVIDRRSDGAKGPIKLRLIVGEGGLDGFDKVDEATVPAEKSEHVFRLKAGAGAKPRRVVLTVKAWLASGSDLQAVDARPSILNVLGSDGTAMTTRSPRVDR